MSRKIEMLYITFIDFREKSVTGSSVRPKRMLEAFKEAGCNVKLISGNQNDYKARKNAFRDLKTYLQNNRPDFCYIEPPSGPFFFECDRNAIKLINKYKIPIGFFYRDIYWKFDSNAFKNRDMDLKNKLKAKIINCMQKRDYQVLKNNISIFYFPSDSVGKCMGLKNYAVLPPGCVERNYKKNKTEELQAIYVGGATKRYGIGLILNAWKNIKHIKLNIICPLEQWKDWLTNYPEYNELEDNVKVYHLSDGKELDNLYYEADFALIPILKTEYNDMAIPIKLYEYVSRGLPIVATNCKEMQQIVENANIGLVTEDSPEKFYEAVIELTEKIQKKDIYLEHLIKMRDENTWLMRAKQVIKDLVEDENEDEEGFSRIK